MSSTAAAAPNSESATSNFIVLRARCRRCVADTQGESERGRTAQAGEAFNPNAIEKLWAAQRSGRGFTVAFTAIFGLCSQVGGVHCGTGTSWQ